MPAIYDPNAPRVVLNLSINSNLLDRVALLDVNLSDTLEKALAEAVAQYERERLVEENRSLLDAAIRLFGDEAQAVQWLTTPARGLGSKCPIEADADEVMELIARLEHGINS